MQELAILSESVGRRCPLELYGDIELAIRLFDSKATASVMAPFCQTTKSKLRKIFKIMEEKEHATIEGDRARLTQQGDKSLDQWIVLRKKLGRDVISSLFNVNSIIYRPLTPKNVENCIVKTSESNINYIYAMKDGRGERLGLLWDFLILIKKHRPDPICYYDMYKQFKTPSDLFRDLVEFSKSYIKVACPGKEEGNYGVRLNRKGRTFISSYEKYFLDNNLFDILNTCFRPVIKGKVLYFNRI